MENIDALTFLKQGRLHHPAHERELMAMRSSLLRKVTQGAPVALELLEALAQFCFDFQYVFAESADDTALLALLDPKRSEHEKWMTACFRPQMPEVLPVNDIEQLRPISDPTSQSVRAQYEEHPYPRWRFLDNVEPPVPAAFKILVAGAGTGRETLKYALQYPNSEIIALDLSRHSLAYALKRAREFNISNVRFVQADLLDAPLLGVDFDFISCHGVLHHMADPLQGLLSLKSVMKPHAHIDISVYSAHARQAILAAIDLRKQMNIPPTTEGVRAFRQIILALPPEHPASGASQPSDFYSVSGARDLLFHVQEHNYTLPMLADFITRAGLRVVTFRGGPALELFTAMGFKDPANLRAWEEVERKNPDAFKRMYRVTVSR